MEERISGQGKRRKRPLKSKNGFNVSGLPNKPELPREKVLDCPFVPNCTIKQPSKTSKTGLGQTSIESSEDEWSDSSFYDLPETLKDSLHRLVHPAEFVIPVHMVSRPPCHATVEAHHIHAFLERPVFSPLSSAIMGDNQEIPRCSPEMHLHDCQAQSVGSRTLGRRKFDGSLYYRQSTDYMLDGKYDGKRNYKIPPGNVYQDVSYTQQSSSLTESQIKVPSIVVVSNNPSNSLSEENFNHNASDVLLGSRNENIDHLHNFKRDLIPDAHTSKSDKSLRISAEEVKDTLQWKSHPADDHGNKKHSPWSVSFANSVNGADNLGKPASFLKEEGANSASLRELRNSRGELAKKGPYLTKQHQSNMSFLEQSRVGLQNRGNHDVKAKKRSVAAGKLHLHQEKKFASKTVPLCESPPTRAASVSVSTDQCYSQQKENSRSIQLLSFYSEHNLFNSPEKPSSLQKQSNVRLQLDGHKTISENQRGSTSFRHKKELFQRQSNLKVTDFTTSSIRSSRYTEDSSLTIEELLSSGSVKSSPENSSSAKLVTMSESNRQNQKEHPVDDFVDDQGRLLSDLSLTNSFSVDTSRRISSALWAMKLMEAAHTTSPNSYEELFIKGRMFRRWFEKTRLKRTLRQEDEVKQQCAVAFWQKKKQHQFFEAWLNAQREETEKADALRRKQMLCKGLRAMRFAVEQRKQSMNELHTRTDLRIMAKYWLKWQRQVQLKATARLREAFDKWQMFKLEQNRDTMLESMADRHVLFKNYTKWKLRYNIEQKNGVASLHYKIDLLTKSWHSWRLYTSQSVVETRLEELARVHYEELLQARLFAIWKENTSKSMVAHSLSSKRIVVKAFHCWKNWTQYAKIIRLRFQSMCKEYRRHKLMKQSFKRWQVRLLNRRADRRYRSVLQGKIFKLWFLRYKRKVIHRHLCRALARKGKKRRFFNRWSNYTKQQQERRNVLVAKLGHWLKGVVFTHWKQHVKRKKLLGNSQLLLTLKRSRLTTRKVMDRWMLAVKVANFTRKARLNWSRRCARKACEAWKILLKKKCLEHRLMDNRKIWQLLILKGMFKKWKQEKRKVDEEVEKATRLKAILARSCKARVLHAWRVANQEQQIISPMVARRERREVARVFDAWRLHIHRQKTIVDQKTRAKEKILDKYFLFWRERAYLSIKERTVEGKLLESKLSRAFSSWRSYVKDERRNRLKVRARRFQLMEKYYTLWKERIHQKAEEKVENTGKEARNVLLVRWAFRFWLKSTDRQREYRLSQQEVADTHCRSTVLRRAWAVWLRSYRVEEWAREHVQLRTEEFLRKIFQAWVKYTKDTVRQEMLQFTTSLSGMDSSFGSVLSPFRSTLGSSLSDTLTSSGYGASVRRGSGSVFTFGVRSSERRDDDTASLPGRIDELDNLLRPESPNTRSLSPISILRDSRPVSPLVFTPALCGPTPSPSPEYHEHHEHHLPITPPVKNEELSPLKSEDDTGIHSGSSDTDHEDDRMSIASFTSFTGHSTQSDMRDREMVATETILHWRNLPLSLTFRTWLKFTRQRKLQKELMNYLKDRKRTELVVNTLATWRRELYTTVTSRQHYLDTTRLRCLKAWHEYTRTKRIQEERKMLADEHRRRTNLKRGFRKWSKKCTSKMKLHHLVGQWQKKAMVTDQDKVSTKKIQELRNVRIVRQTFMYWRQMAKKSQEANRLYTEKLLPKCFAAWHILSSTRVTNRRKEVLFRERRLLTMAFREWQIRFRSLNRAVEFIEIKETDGLLKIVRGWHNWASGMSTRRRQWRHFRRSVELKCMGEIFADWLNAAQQIILARRNYELHMLRSVFRCWKDVALQRSSNRRKMHEFKVNCAANLLARSFQFWQRLLTHTEALRTHRQQHDQDSLRECFEEWRGYTLEIRADKFQVAAVQHKMFLCWYDKYCSRKTTRRLIHKWKIMTEEAKILNSKAMQFIVESNKRKLQRVFAVWVQEARKIQKANGHAQTSLKTCVLLGLHQFVHRRAEHRQLLREIQERKSLQMLSSSFKSWKERYQRNLRNLEILEGHLEKKEEELKKYCLVKWVKFMLRCKAEKFYQKQLVHKSFSVWWFALYTKKGAEGIREKMLKRRTREAGLHWKQWTNKVRRQSEMATELKTRHAQRLVKCYFNQWVERTRRMQKATQQHRANALKRSFVEWRKVVKKTIEMREKIKNFHNQTMKKKASRMFYEWRKTLKVVLKQKQLIDSQMTLHNRRMKQGCLREWRKFTLKNRAEKHCNKNVIVKFFLKWKVDTEFRLEEKERMQKQEEIADRHYRQTLSKTCFRAWLYDVKVELHLKEREQRLLEKHYNMWKKRIALNSIAEEMGDRRMYEKYWRTWRHQLIRKRVSELMMKHEEKKQLSEVFMTWYRMTLVRRRLLKEWNLYKTKKLFRLWMQKYNES